MISVSLLVPMYNAEPYIERCVNSIRQQSYEPLEVVVVDDGSTDGSLELCRRLTAGDSRFRIVTKRNGGEWSARNRALAEATGDWICWVDADDYIDADYVKNLAEAQERSGCDLVIGGLHEEYGGAATCRHVMKPGTYDMKEAPRAAFEAFGRDNLGVSMSKLFNRSIIAQHQLAYCSKMKLALDLDFLLRYVACCHGIVSVAAADYHYDMRMGSVSRRLYSLPTELNGMRRINSAWWQLERKFGLSRGLLSLHRHSLYIFCYRLMLLAYTSVPGLREGWLWIKHKKE